MRLIVMAFAMMFFSSSIQAMEYSRLVGTFTMTGEIVKGDGLRFLAELASWDVPPRIFAIQSHGGSLEDAMMIGEIIRDSQIPVWVSGPCYSACVFIYVAGVEREIFDVPESKIGLHRPYFDKKYFSSISSFEAKDKYEELKKQSVEYLKNMEVSQSVIERIFSTGSTEVDILSTEEAENLLGFRSPFYEEWLTARCGKYTPEQEKVLHSLSALYVLRANFQLAKNNKLAEAEEFFGSKAEELLKEAKLAYQMEQAGMLDPYIELSNVHKRCEEKSSNEHVFGFHNALKSYAEKLDKLALEKYEADRLTK